MLCPHCRLAIDCEYILLELKREEALTLSREQLIERLEKWQKEHGKRTYKTGTVFKLKNGSWCGFVSLGHAADGSRLRKKVTGRTREIVEARVVAIAKAAGISPRQPRPLSNRSEAQLQKMYAETFQSGQ